MRETIKPVEAATTGVDLTPEAVSALGPELVSRLREAVVGADLDTAVAVLNKAQDGHPDVVAALRVLVVAYDYDQLLELL